MDPNNNSCINLNNNKNYCKDSYNKNCVYVDNFTCRDVSNNFECMNPVPSNYYRDYNMVCMILPDNYCRLSS